MADDELKPGNKGESWEHGQEVWDGRTERRYRHRNSSRRHWRIIQWVIIFVETLVIFFLLIWANLLDKDKQELLEESGRLSQQINEGKKAMEVMQLNIDKLMKDQTTSCLSTVIPLKFDQVVEINKSYIKSGIFFLVGKKEKQNIEFKLILENKNQSPIFPLLEVVFLNAAGKQIGISRVGYNKDGTPGHEVLEVGEIRSFAATYEINRDDKPESFMIKLKND